MRLLVIIYYISFNCETVFVFLNRVSKNSADILHDVYILYIVRIAHEIIIIRSI